MKTKPLSASSIKTYLQCLLKYKYRYIEKKPVEQNKDALVLGTAVHEALEEMYTIVNNEDVSSAELYKRVYKKFMDTATAEGLGKLNLFQEGKDMVTRRLDRLSKEEKVVGLETRFHLETKNGTPFTGAIDKLVELDEKTVVVVDYKTSKTAFTQTEADVDIQMSMYDLAVHMMYPQYETIVVVFDYVRLEEEVISHRTDEQRNLFVEFLDSLYEQMKALPEDEMLAQLNEFCGWCGYKNFCPKFAEVINHPDLTVARPDSMTDDEFISEWERIKNIARAVDSRKRSLQTQVNRRMRAGGKKISAEGKELYKVQTTRVSYNTRALFDVIPPEDLPNLVTPNAKSLERYAQNNPHLKEQIEEAASYTHNNAYYKTRKVKD